MSPRVSWSGAALAAVSALIAAKAPAGAGVPPLDHVVVVVMENKDYDQVRDAPYTASLISGGAELTDSHAITHPSQPNYLALWAAASLGVTDNTCPAPGTPFIAENLGHACEAAGKSWRAYSEDLPATGSNVCDAAGGLYARRHEPWTNFGNLEHSNEGSFADLTADLEAHALPALAFVVPNNCHNTHDCSVATGDDWLASQVPPILSELGPRGALILTWDEDGGTPGNDNHILTVFAGSKVKPSFVSPATITHHRVVRTICDALGLVPFGGAANVEPIADVWLEEVTAAGEPGAQAATLSPPVPNPSRGREVEARLSLPHGTRFEAGIVDLAGRRIRRLDHGVALGARTLRWDGRDQDGTRMTDGVYWLEVRHGAGSRLCRTLILGD